VEKTVESSLGNVRNYTNYQCNNNIVKWLSKGKDLEIFWSNSKKTLVFRKSEQNVKAELFSAF